MAVNGTFPKSRKQLQVQGFLDLNKFRMNSTEEVFVMGLLSPPPHVNCTVKLELYHQIYHMGSGFFPSL